MPLVVPGLQSKGGASAQGGNSQEDWMNKLMGKKLGEQHDEITFAKQDLPQQHRVLQPDSMKTMDYRPERLNIHVDEEGTVRDVKFG